jgi:hypothetical protein
MTSRLIITHSSQQVSPIHRDVRTLITDADLMRTSSCHSRATPLFKKADTNGWG